MSADPEVGGDELPVAFTKTLRHLGGLPSNLPGKVGDATAVVTRRRSAPPAVRVSARPVPAEMAGGPTGRDAG